MSALVATTPGDLVSMTAEFGIVAASFLVFGLLLGALWGTRRTGGRRGWHVAGQPSGRYDRRRRMPERRDAMHGVRRPFGPGQW